jgi:hypothetical protein
MTYKKHIPEIVFSRWKTLNPEYIFDFSLDRDCEAFLKENFNDYVAKLFLKIPVGMYKADLWRLCKLYINGGVYADVDLVPYINIDKLLDKNISFYSCIGADQKSIFQAFMVNFSKPKNPLILHFLLSFLQKNPYNSINGPCFDMYDCIKHNLDYKIIKPNIKYEIEEVKILVEIGSSDKNTKKIDLHYFPMDIDYHIVLNKNPHKDTLNFSIENNTLIATRTDESSGWGHNHSANICIKSKESILLFQEVKQGSYQVLFNNTKILDSRDPNYVKKRGW